LTWVARGKTSAEIAQILGLTKRTVDFHTDSARGKLGAATRTEAAIKAATGKLLSRRVPFPHYRRLASVTAEIPGAVDNKNIHRGDLWQALNWNLPPSPPIIK
jgi:hypothetical protein